MFSYKKVGGLRFLKIGRLQLQFSIAKRKPAPTKQLTPLQVMIAREIMSRVATPHQAAPVPFNVWAFA